MSFGPNQLHPLLIEDARSAAHRASELQRGVEDRIRTASRELAEAERVYREALSKRIVALYAEGKAITACSDIARGESEIARLRYERDVKQGVLEAARQEAFRRGADRKDIDTLLRWSQARDLRADTPPADWSEQPNHGGGKPELGAVA